MGDMCNMNRILYLLAEYVTDDILPFYRIQRWEITYKVIWESILERRTWEIYVRTFQYFTSGYSLKLLFCDVVVWEIRDASVFFNQKYARISNMRKHKIVIYEYCQYYSERSAIFLVYVLNKMIKILRDKSKIRIDGVGSPLHSRYRLKEVILKNTDNTFFFSCEYTEYGYSLAWLELMRAYNFSCILSCVVKYIKMDHGKNIKILGFLWIKSWN